MLHAGQVRPVFKLQAMNVLILEGLIILFLLGFIAGKLQLILNELKKK
jgi:hypothetical protein